MKPKSKNVRVSEAHWLGLKMVAAKGGVTIQAVTEQAARCAYPGEVPAKTKTKRK